MTAASHLHKTQTVPYHIRVYNDVYTCSFTTLLFCAGQQLYSNIGPLLLLVVVSYFKVNFISQS